ncbi:N-acetylmuramoyl-L-alanine amidase [Tritonibacter horizontis]|uniref:N-acetylmuramoyl-L-alanine amidase n=1 Tax=Tritonibacter horizontis TaxID=1768241 RepID=A0A132BV63_9RHOB|nr:N-acetylmuramoyl-L-alanine amidase [Tritonibacter horizontis]KUP92275.1 N-acetylmuramoyl-L-alanine amidase AmiC precursor [Tritonibacter horizontis]
MRLLPGLFAVAVALMCLPIGASAQGFSALARVLPEHSRLVDDRAGARLELGLSQGVPYRIFTLDDPRRVVLDFQEVDWTGLRADPFIVSDIVRDIRYGGYVPGWSRMVLELETPMQIAAAAMTIDTVSAEARLVVELEPIEAAAFAAGAGAPYDPRLDLPQPAPIKTRPPRDADAPLLVMLDPGHGGLDPGAEAEGGIAEKDLMLSFAYDLGERLVRSGGFEVLLTREGDYFVSLERRIAMAHRQGADLFLSLHADSVSEGMAHGTVVYTLSKAASDVASAKLAERHDRADLLSGSDLSKVDDEVTDVLLDLARQETHPRSAALAQSVIEALMEQGGPVNRRPLRSAGFSVLKSADIPSVLIELGFMSSPRDLEHLTDPEWRARAAQGILNGLLNWREADAARRALVRQ